MLSDEQIHHQAEFHNKVNGIRPWLGAAIALSTILIGSYDMYEHMDWENPPAAGWHALVPLVMPFLLIAALGISRPVLSFEANGTNYYTQAGWDEHKRG